MEGMYKYLKYFTVNYSIYFNLNSLDRLLFRNHLLYSGERFKVRSESQVKRSTENFSNVSVQD